jgi:predicted Zn-dependent protease
MILAAAAALLCVTAPPAFALDPQISAYVQQVGNRVTLGQASVGDLPRTFQVREAASVAAGLARPGVVEVTTGLLAALDNEAQLANILAYEQARAARQADRRTPKRQGAGSRIAQAAAVGAAAGAAGGAAREIFKDENRILRDAATGAATAAAATAVYASWPRRQNRSGARIDDNAAQAGLRAAIASGYDGQAAVGAWARVGTATPLGAVEGGYGDPKADRKRYKAQREVLRKARGKTSGEIGKEAYRTAVLERLDRGR